MTERIFACINGNAVVNTFVGSPEFAELARPDYDDVREITDVTPLPGLRWTVHEDGYRPPPEYPSWVWVDGAWQPPVPQPETGNWVWVEFKQAWVEVPPAGE